MYVVKLSKNHVTMVKYGAETDGDLKAIVTYLKRIIATIVINNGPDRGKLPTTGENLCLQRRLCDVILE